MATPQGDLALLHDPVARTLLQSTIPARLAYTWTDGSLRVVPIWFHWTGAELVLGTPATAPKLRALRRDPRVALTIDSTEGPGQVLMVRGVATIALLDGVVPEYAAAAERYNGPEEGQAWIAQVREMWPQMARIAIRPAWVGLLDFETRFPSFVPV